MDSPGRPGDGYAERLAGYGDVSTALALRSDRELGALVDGAPVIGSGIGGGAARLVVEGRPVFVKRIPLTDLECRPEHMMSTANLFGLPAFFQYGVGSAGFGAWRELAAHVMTTNWVLGRRCGSFPLLCHWRVLAGAPAVPPDGRRLYLADLGLASSPRFALSDGERAFLRNHLTYYRCQTLTELVNWLVAALAGAGSAADRDELVRRYADGAEPAAAPSPAAAVIRRYAPIATVMNGFYRRLHRESRTTPYPADQLRRLCAAIGVVPGQPRTAAGRRAGGY